MRQEVMLQELGVEEMFIGIASGKDTDRPQLTKMMNFIRRGNIVIAESIGRFARNTKDLLELLEKQSAKEVTFTSKKEATSILINIATSTNYRFRNIVYVVEKF